MKIRPLAFPATIAPITYNPFTLVSNVSGIVARTAGLGIDLDAGRAQQPVVRDIPGEQEHRIGWGVSSVTPSFSTTTVVGVISHQASCRNGPRPSPP